MLLSQFPLIFLKTKNRMSRFIAHDYSCADLDSLCNHLRDVPWEDIFNLGASALYIYIYIY